MLPVIGQAADKHRLRFPLGNIAKLQTSAVRLTHRKQFVLSSISFEKHSIYCATERLAFSCGARSSIQAEGKRLLEKHAIAPSAARHC